MKTISLISLITASFLFAFSSNAAGVYPEEIIDPPVGLSNLEIKLHIGSSGSIQVGWSSSEDGTFGWFYDGWLDFSGFPDASGFQEFEMHPISDILTCNVINVDPETGKDWIVRCRQDSVARIVWLEWYGDGLNYSGPTRLSDVFASLLASGGAEFWVDVDAFGNPEVRSGTMPFDFDDYLEGGLLNPAPKRFGIYSDVCDNGLTPATWSSSIPFQKTQHGKKHKGLDTK